MAARWKSFRFRPQDVLCIILVVCFQSHGCSPLNLEGLALLDFRSKVEFDPYRILESWNPQDSDPCRWSGVHCVDGKVEMLNLNGLSLKGILAPELAELSRLRVLILCNNSLTGVIPKEIGRLTRLELLDLRANDLSGTVPVEIREMLSLKHLLLANNSFQGDMPSQAGDLDSSQLDKNLSIFANMELGCMNRKIRDCFLQNKLQQVKKHHTSIVLLKEKLMKFIRVLPLLKFRKDSPSELVKESQNLENFSERYNLQHKENHVNFARRIMLQETSNLLAAPVASGPIQEVVDVPSSGSGSFPALLSIEKETSLSETSILKASTQSTPTTNQLTNQSEKGKKFGIWAYVLAILVALAILITASILFTGRPRNRASVSPWESGLSGQLQKALIEGVPQLNREELEVACEDFSNIIQTYPECVLYKGTLSSGVEIAVVSSVISSPKNWSKRSETYFKKKIDTLSRVNHKNFVNLLGYCEEDEPFMRMMVFEYAPSGSLYEHLHGKGLEHIDWGARMRIIMGIAYCLQYMHHELDPPVAHSNLQSSAVFLTDDYAAKVAEMDFWKEVITKEKIPGDDETDSEILSVNPGSNVYDFGVLLLEIISGKKSYSEEHGSIVDWAMGYFKNKQNLYALTDPALKTIKNNHLDVLCDVIYQCVYEDPKRRPTMKEVTTKLRNVLAISPDTATPRLSPLWWAELEILSVEAS